MRLWLEGKTCEGKVGGLEDGALTEVCSVWLRSDELVGERLGCSTCSLNTLNDGDAEGPFDGDDVGLSDGAWVGLFNVHTIAVRKQEKVRFESTIITTHLSVGPRDGTFVGCVVGLPVIAAILSGLGGTWWQPPSAFFEKGNASNPPASHPKVSSKSYATFACIKPKPVLILHPCEEGLTSFAVNARTFLIWLLEHSGKKDHTKAAAPATTSYAWAVVEMLLSIPSNIAMSHVKMTSSRTMRSCHWRPAAKNDNITMRTWYKYLNSYNQEYTNISYWDAKQIIISGQSSPTHNKCIESMQKLLCIPIHRQISILPREIHLNIPYESPGRVLLIWERMNEYLF